MAVVADCPGCGETLKFKNSAIGKVARCRHCGENVPVRPASAPRVRSRSARGRTRRKKAKSSWKTPLLVGGGVLGLVVFVGAVALLLNQKETPSSESVESGRPGEVGARNSDAALANVVVSEEGQFPDSLQKPPDWLADDPLFDVPALFETPLPEENAAPLYLDAFYDVEPSLADCFPGEPDRKPIAQNRSDRLAAMFPVGRDPNFNAASRDAILPELEPVLRKVQLAQQRPKCMFQTGIAINALIAHCQGARNVQRAAVLRLDLALEHDDFDKALDLIELSLRMSRDLGPRGGYICQLVSIATESIAYLRMVEPFLADPKLKPEHTQRLARIFLEHKANRVDAFLTGSRVEYLSHRIVIHDLEHRTGTFPPNRSVGEVFNEFGEGYRIDSAKFDLALSRLTPAHFKREAEFLIESQRLVETMHDRPYAIRQHAWKTREQQMKDEVLLLVARLAPPRALFDDAATKGECRLNAYLCVTGVKLWQQQHGSYPDSLADAVQSIELSEIPRDAYEAGGAIKYAFVSGQPVVYSVGSDGIDQGGRSDWKFGQQPGDFLFPLP